MVMGAKGKNKDIVAYSTNDVLKKSNFFINSKFKQSITEIQITHLAMMKIQDGDYVKADDGLYVSMKAVEIRKFLKKKSGSFYDKLAKVANSMAGTTMGIMDKENDSFHFLTLVNRADYEDGVFTIRYPKELTDYLVNIQSNFTPITREIVASMGSAYTYKLYEILRRQCFYPTGYTGIKNNIFQFRVPLSELKLSIGLVDSSEKGVKRVLDNSRATKDDYDRAVGNSKESNYKVYTDFNRHVLKPSVEEINEKTDIFVQYDEIRAGYGGRVEWIEFTVELLGRVQKSDIKHENKEIDEEETQTVVLETKKELSQTEKFVFWTYVMQKFANLNIRPEDAITLSDAADYSTERIDTAYDVMEASGSDIDNVVGWLKTAILEEWKPNKRVRKSSNASIERKKDLDKWLNKQVADKIK